MSPVLRAILLEPSSARRDRCDVIEALSLTGARSDRVARLLRFRSDVSRAERGVLVAFAIRTSQRPIIGASRAITILSKISSARPRQPGRDGERREKRAFACGNCFFKSDHYACNRSATLASARLVRAG